MGYGALCTYTFSLCRSKHFVVDSIYLQQHLLLFCVITVNFSVNTLKHSIFFCTTIFSCWLICVVQLLFLVTKFVCADFLSHNAFCFCQNFFVPYY